MEQTAPLTGKFFTMPAAPLTTLNCPTISQVSTQEEVCKMVSELGDNLKEWTSRHERPLAVTVARSSLCGRSSGINPGEDSWCVGLRLGKSHPFSTLYEME